MVVRDENVVLLGLAEPRIDLLKGDAVAGIDDVRNALVVVLFC